MKRTSAIWGSVSILIGAVIAILSLLRGVWATVLLLAAFAVWGLWLVFTQMFPAWKSNRVYRRRAHQPQNRQEAASEDSDSTMGLVLLRHVNHRISEHLRAVYPDAHWEWTVANPVRFIACGGTGRIRVYGVQDYDYADVTLDRQGGLRCSLVKLAPLDDTDDPSRQPLDPRVWFELRGRSVLENLIADLRSRGHSSLTMNEDGSISIQPAGGGEEIEKDFLAGFPEKVYWPRLAEVLEQEGLATDVQDTKIQVSW